jgi:hypothetical protein
MSSCSKLHQGLRYIRSVASIRPHLQPIRCREYASVDFIPAPDEGKFDYVAVDGRSRMLCLKRALKLVKPQVLLALHPVQVLWCYILTHEAPLD